MHANHPFSTHPPLWLYHDLSHDQWRRPEHHNLCLETVQRHCSRSFRIVQLDRYSVYKYIPDLPREVWVKCSPSQRVDLMRWELLCRYGGMFLDADVLVMQDLQPIMRKLREHDFVAFGAGPQVHMSEQQQVHPVGRGRGIRTYTPPSLGCDRSPSEASLRQPFHKPLTWAMASRPEGQLVRLARKRAYWLIRNDAHRLYASPHLLGRDTLWFCMDQLRQQAAASPPPPGTPAHWSYFRVSNECAGHDRHDRTYTKARLLREGAFDEQCLREGVFVVPLNPEGGRSCGFPMWFVKASREELLGELGHTVVGGLWRRSLGLG